MISPEPRKSMNRAPDQPARCFFLPQRNSDAADYSTGLRGSRSRSGSSSASRPRSVSGSPNATACCFIRSRADTNAGSRHHPREIQRLVFVATHDAEARASSPDVVAPARSSCLSTRKTPDRVFLGTGLSPPRPDTWRLRAVSRHRCGPPSDRRHGTHGEFGWRGVWERLGALLLRVESRRDAGAGADAPLCLVRGGQ
jgi:hypothetical protein